MTKPLLTPAQEAEALRRYMLARSLRKQAAQYKSTILAERFDMTRGRIDRLINIGLDAALASKSYQSHTPEALRELQSCLDRRAELLSQVAEHTALKIAADLGVNYRKLMQDMEYKIGRDAGKPAPKVEREKTCPVAWFLTMPAVSAGQSMGYY